MLGPGFFSPRYGMLIAEDEDKRDASEEVRGRRPVESRVCLRYGRWGRRRDVYSVRDGRGTHAAQRVRRVS